jgi:ribosomal protein S27AE
MKHIHRYKKVNLATTPHKEYLVYRCILPNCNHYLQPALLIGKQASCPRCGEEYIIAADLARLTKPHCRKCTAGKEKPERIRLREFKLEMPGLE